MSKSEKCITQLKTFCIFNQAEKLHEVFLKLEEKHMSLASELNIFIKNRLRSSYVVNSLLTRINKGSKTKPVFFQYLSS